MVAKTGTATTVAMGALPKPDRELSFDPAVLIEAGENGLDVEKFVASVRMKAPLSVVREDLRALLDAIHNELVACVQKDFSTFVSLGPSIAQADTMAGAAVEPLASLRSELATLVSSLDADMQSLSATLAKRRALSDQAESLRVLLRANDLLVKCERLLKDYAALNESSDAAMRLLERIAGESAQLSFTLSRAEGGAFIQNIAVRVSVVRRNIRAHLEAWLRRALFPSNKPTDGSPFDNDVLTRVLGAYVVAGLGSDAEEFFRREIVAPFCNASVRMTTALGKAERAKKATPGVGETELKTGGESAVKSVASSHSASVSAADALEVVEQEILEFLGDRVMPIASLCAAEERLKDRLDFLTRSVWPQLSKAITGNMSAAFSPGVPEVFHQSFMSASRIYGAIESAVASDVHLEALHGCASTKDFWKHWNLPVYFQLRFQEISSKFDSEMRRGPVGRSSDDSDTGSNFSAHRLLRSDVYSARATAAMVNALRTCWSKDVFLKPLAHRFLRFSLQLLARYVTWVRTGLAGEWSGDDAIPNGAARVLADVSIIRKRIPAEFSSLLRVHDIGASPELLQDIDGAVSEAVSQYASLPPELARSMSDALSEACIEKLQPLRGILATYRMPQKPVPTTHSPFVPKILRPLKAFLNEHRGQIDDEICADMARTVVEATTRKYHEMATDLISSNKKSEETLRRLNIGRGGGGTGGEHSTRSTTDKVAMQLYLDVAKYKDDLDSLGVDPKTIESMKELWDSVKRDESAVDTV